jgi:hypothetical protein
MEWVVHAEADRFTVNLAYKVPDDMVNSDKPVSCGYVKSHTHRHICPMPREEWEREVVNAATHLWLHYTEANKYAQWADELMRRNR